jgi:hypothetical protein
VAGNGLVVEAAAAQSNPAGNRIWPSVTTSVPNAALNCFASIASNLTSTPQADMVERWDTGTLSRSYLMTKTVVDAGATGTSTATGSAVASNTVTVAVVEGAAGPTPPNAPTGLSAVASSTSQIDLSWTDNSADGTGFEVQRSDDGSTGWSTVGSNAANDTTFSDLGLPAGTTFYYRVKATGASADSAFSNVANATTQSDVPLAPANLVATVIAYDRIDLT